MMGLEKKITSEYENKRKVAGADLVQFLESNSFSQVRAYFLYYAKADSWEGRLGDLLEYARAVFEKDDSVLKEEYLKLLVFLAIDLKSYAIQWNLVKELDQKTIRKGRNRILETVIELEKSFPASAESVHNYFCRTAAGRLTAEAVESSAIPGEVEKACGDSLESYIHITTEQIQASSIYQMAIRNKDSKTRMVLGNDYGEYLNDTIWLGMSYTTTNPPLVNMVWDIDREGWSSKLDKAVMDEIGSDISKDKDLLNACSLGALIVVEKNCRLLRNIFLTTSGNEGYACFQVNPENHDNTEGMVDEVRYVYSLLEKRLGGIPNVSFKLPGTSASLKAAEVLSREGISLTITLEFCVFQALAFAKILQSGNAVTSNVVVMNGRLAFPVRDELLEMGVVGAEDAAKSAGVEVTRKLYRKLYSTVSEGGLGIDAKKVRIMNASLRIYGTEIPDISEIMGPQVMTIFPNVRRVWDSVERAYNPETIKNETPPESLEILKKSEIFRQAWWTEEDEEDGKPEKVLTMDDGDKESVKSWIPIKATLGQFLSSYTDLRTQVNAILKNRGCQSFVRE